MLDDHLTTRMTKWNLFENIAFHAGLMISSYDKIHMMILIYEDMMVTHRDVKRR